MNDNREKEKSIDSVVSEPADVPDPSTNSTQRSAPIHKKRQNKRSAPDSKCSALEKKFNHAYDVFTSTVNKGRDEDTCFGEYVGESLKKIQDRKVKASVRHSISTILYQAECGGTGGPFPPLFHTGFISYPGPQQTVQYPAPHAYNQPCSSNSSASNPQLNSPQSSYPSPQTSNIEPQYSPVQVQINQEDDYQLINLIPPN